ncbi:MarR family transcriptional regulator [Nakamurella antarctica]|uniref:MarR family transcriptional regulator n=1 Tax=Nakamurella antarctica TaxID=1902245 RepID=A0A3G8ZRD1_9ACTN|nr:MarR family transcriptional regulator [Nakamurella antarctica]
MDATDQTDRDYATDLCSQVVDLVKTINVTKAKALNAQDSDHSDYVLLVTLVKEGPRRASDLAGHACVDPSTVSRQVASLVKAGWVERQADPDDGRASILVPTAAGAARVENNIRLRGMVMAPVISGWSHAERDTFARLLSEFIDGVTGNFDIVKETVALLVESGHTAGRNE